MSISRTKQIKINKEANQIIKEYLSILEKKNSVCRKINKQLQIPPATLLPIEQLMSSASKSGDSKTFNILVNKRISYAVQAEQCKQKMVTLFEPVIDRIIETEYSAYPEYRKYLHQAGVLGVRQSMGQVYPEPYLHYCQRIIVEMYRFLDENRLIKE